MPTNFLAIPIYRFVEEILQEDIFVVELSERT
jgi:hypothetical protein